jgi:hypothetical protein
LLDPLGPVEATLRIPPALNTALDGRVDGERAELLLGDALVAEARLVSELELDVPPAPDPERAARAGSACPWADEHPYAECFSCGPARREPDGLHNLTGPLDSEEIVADTWTLDQSQAGADGRADPRIVWAALDCPTGNGALYFHPTNGPVLLGRLTAGIDRLPAVGERLVVAGWPVRREGRKHVGGSALFDAEGTAIARAEGLWIELRPS